MIVFFALASIPRLERAGIRAAMNAGLVCAALRESHRQQDLSYALAVVGDLRLFARFDFLTRLAAVELHDAVDIFRQRLQGFD